MSRIFSHAAFALIMFFSCNAGAQPISIGGDGVHVDVGGLKVDVDNNGVFIGGKEKGPDLSDKMMDPSIAVREEGVSVHSGRGRREDSWRRRESSHVTSIETEILIGALNATRNEEGIRVDLEDQVLFDFDSSSLNPDSFSIMGNVAQLIRNEAGESSVAEDTAHT